MKEHSWIPNEPNSPWVCELCGKLSFAFDPKKNPDRGECSGSTKDKIEREIRAVNKSKMPNVSLYPWKRQFAITGVGSQIITLISPKLPGGGYYEICRQDIEGEPPEAIDRIKADFTVMSASIEMLQALEGLLSEIDKMFSGTAQGTAIDNARAAVRKARGETE